MNIKEFLESNDYRNWKTDTDNLGEVAHFQKRMDKKEGFENYPLCLCNDKLLLNVEHHKYTIHGKDYESCQISLVHENQDTDWCDLRIYSLSPEKLKENLQKYELKILDMWEVFNGEIKEDPCKNCSPKIVCKTPFCNRLKMPHTTEYVGKRNAN